MEEYKTWFEFLSNKLRGRSDCYKLSCFLSRLRDEIRPPMRMFNPSTLTIAYSLAKIQKENLNLAKNPTKHPTTI